MSSKKAIAIVAGAGPGTGASVARAFARKGYAVALLARTPSKLLDLESQITSEGGTAASFPADLTQRASLTSAFTSISEKFGADTPIKVFHLALVRCPSKHSTNPHTTQVAILNAGGHMVVKPFLECTDEELQKSTLEKLQGAFVFSQLAIEAFKKHDEGKGSTLIFSGATAALKGSAKFGLFAAGSFGLRALSQSLAREFQPQGIHVSHLIIDGERRVYSRMTTLVLTPVLQG